MGRTYSASIIANPGEAWVRRNRRWGSALCVLCLALLVAALFAACDQSSAKKAPARTPSATMQPADALPAFSDWRAAYLGADGRAHAVTLDGKTDVAGPILPDLSSPYLGFESGGISPDGHLVVYAPPSLNIVDLTGQHADILQERTLAYTMCWSPDSGQLALDQGNGAIAIANTRDGTSTLIQGSPANTVGNLIGWLDSTHLAVTDIQNQMLVTTPNGDQYGTSIAIASLNVTTGKVRMIARISSPGLGFDRFTLSPDGTKAMFSNTGGHGFPFTPIVDEIDMTSGVITPLPAIDQATGSDFTRISWQPGTDNVAVSTGFIVNGDLKNWLLDMGNDTAQPLSGDGYVAGWAPSTGGSTASGTLVLTTGQQIENGAGPFTLTALAIGANGQVASSTTLTQAAMTFPFLGFVRTA